MRRNHAHTALGRYHGAIELFLGAAGRHRSVRLFSIEGFWHSFRAILYVLPFFAINSWPPTSHAARDRAWAEPVPNGAFIAARLLEFPIDLLRLPVLLALLAKRLGITRSYAPLSWSATGPR